MINSILANILVFGGVIFFHELGHFMVARMLGIGVPVFSLGFGPKLLSFSRGRTEYRLSAVPFGGYVRLAGDTPDGEIPEGFTEAESFNNRPPLHRMMVVLAGPLGNVLLAWLILTGLFLAQGRMEMLPVVGELMPGGAAQAAGIQPGDRILSIDGQPIAYWSELSQTIGANQGAPLSITLERGGRQMDLTITPKIQDRKNLFGEEIKTPMIGITSSGETTVVPLNGASAAWEAAKETVRMGTVMVQAIVKMIERIIPADTLGGPIMIVQMISEQAKNGLTPLLLTAAMLSVNLGLVNLLPIPVLDGGHILFFAIELVTRRKLNEQVQQMALRIGILIIFSLIGFVIYNDIYRILQ